MKVLLIFVLWSAFPGAAFAHDSSFTPPRAEVLTILHPQPSASGGSYVLLPDGSRYYLDSDFWRATEALAGSRSLGAVLDLEKKNFWLNLKDHALEFGLMGAEAFRRYGPVTMAMVAMAEAVEHTFLPPGTPPACLLVQAGCVISSRQMQEIWNTLRYRYPGNVAPAERFQTSAQVSLARFQFWRSMRRVFGTDSETAPVMKKDFKRRLPVPSAVQKQLLPTPFWGTLISACDGGAPAEIECMNSESPFRSFRPALLRPVGSGLKPIERYFAAREQTAFLGLILQLDRQQAKQVSGGFWARSKRRMVIADMARAVDRYELILGRMALRALNPVEAARSRRLIENFVTSFFQFQTAFTSGEQAGELSIYPKIIMQRLLSFERLGSAQGCELSLLRRR